MKFIGILNGLYSTRGTLSGPIRNISTNRKVKGFGNKFVLTSRKMCAHATW